MKDITLLNHISSLADPSSKQTNNVGSGFTDILKDVVAETSKEQIASDKAIEKLNTGEAKNIHEVMISMEKADISMRLLVQMRNKIVDAYKEVMRMQV